MSYAAQNHVNARTYLFLKSSKELLPGLIRLGNNASTTSNIGLEGLVYHDNAVQPSPFLRLVLVVPRNPRDARAEARWVKF